MDVGLGFFMVFFLLVIGSIIYFVPCIIARGKKHFTAILLITIFLGWTIVGWVAAFVWAILSPKKSLMINFAGVPNQNQPIQDHSKTDEISKLHDLLVKGAITEQEYNTKKAKLL